MTGKEYWIWLSSALGQGARVDEVTAAFPDPAVLFECGRRERILSGVFTKARLDKLESTSLDDAKNAVSLCEKNGWQIITPDSAEYPAMLSRFPDMPLVLYVHGDLSCLDGKVAIAVVGTRNPTYESIKIAKQLSGDMARRGAVIISGGALGIDSAAHEGALSAGSPTVCVLGCGLGTRYLMSNEALRREITANGALVSEYPPFAQASKTSFPLRNRIISGLSHGVVVVEAGEKSGSLITANYAAEQGKEVFAVPGSILSTAYTGANRLIRDGARAVTCADDVLSSFDYLYPDRLEQTKGAAKESKAPPSGADALAVYKLLGKEPLHPDEISARSGLPLARVITALMELELDGYVEQTNGKNYILA